MGLLVGIALFVVGSLMLYKGSIIKQEVEKYEFDNTTDGGVVKYTDFKQADKMKRRKILGTQMGMIGCIPMLLGAAVIAIFVLSNMYS